MSVLMNNRGEIESLVISALFQDLSLIADVSLTDKDFIFPKTKFFFNLVKESFTQKRKTLRFSHCFSKGS